MLRMPQRINFNQSFDVSLICSLFREDGWVPVVTHYEDPNVFELINEFSIRYGVPSQSWDVSYRKKIESVALALDAMGVTLIPSLQSVLSYENKALSAEIAQAYKLPGPQTRYIVSRDEARRITEQWGFPFVAKTVSGFASRGVQLIRNEREWNACVRLNVATSGSPEKSFPGIVVQEFIHGLVGDWKVIVMGDVVATLWRGIRPGDFRASGSGRFEFKKAPDHVLDFALDVRRLLRVPWASLDIADNGTECAIIEHQIVHFGTTTADKALEHYRASEGGWISTPGPIPMEKEMVKSVLSMIDETP